MPCRVIKTLKDIQGSRLIAAIPGAEGGARVFPARRITGDFWRDGDAGWRPRRAGEAGVVVLPCLQE